MPTIPSYFHAYACAAQPESQVLTDPNLKPKNVSITSRLDRRVSTLCSYGYVATATFFVCCFCTTPVILIFNAITDFVSCSVCFVLNLAVLTGSV